MTLDRSPARRTRRRVAVCCAAALALAGLATAHRADASYAHARTVGKRCSTCHTGTRPAPDNLNDTGRYFLEHRTLSGAPGPAGMPGPLAVPAPAPAPNVPPAAGRPDRAALAPFIVESSPATP